MSQNTYFWQHGSSTQLSDKMANIRQVHPAFFDIAYNDYYLEHCKVLEAQLEAGEKVGGHLSVWAPHIFPRWEIVELRTAGGEPWPRQAGRQLGPKQTPPSS